MRQLSNALVADAAPVPAEQRLSIDDDRWLLAQRVATGPLFARSPLLTKFLLHVVAETLAGRRSAITEHRLGIAVFGRPQSYRTDEDNIVRNYARQLRKRLAEHFEGVGRHESMRIAIPLGTYVPVFEPAARTEADSRLELEAKAEIHESTAEDSQSRYARGNENAWWRRRGIAFLLTSLVLAGFTAAWLAGSRLLPTQASSNPGRALWRAVFTESGQTFIVPPDAGFNLMEDVAQRSVPLPEYINGGFDLPSHALNNHAREDLRAGQYTDFTTLQLVTMLARQVEYDPRRVTLRFPRDLRIDDLKDANAILIGSANANPWAALADAHTNFHIKPGDTMEGATILNAHPQPGEQPAYASHWNQPSHDTYALILFEPNLSGKGHLLAIEGLDVAGTQAAAELLFHPDALSTVFRRASRSDGSLRPFEVLVRATSIQSSAAGTQITGVRID